MASTNKTTNLELSQFLGTDKPAWLTDYNSDMQKIDDGFKKQANDIVALDGRTTDLETGLSNSNTKIETVKNDIQSLKDEDVIIKRDINTLSTNYDVIHHEVAVNAKSIEQQNVEIQDIKDGYLPLSGGEMTGDLKLNQNGLLIKTNYGRTDEITANSYTSFRFVDKNNKGLFTIQYGRYTSGERRLNISLYHDKNGEEKQSIITLKVSADGTAYVTGPTPPNNSASGEIVTASWVRKLLVDLGMSGAAAATSSDNTLLDNTSLDNTSLDNTSLDATESENSL